MKFTFYLGQAENRSLKMDKVIPEFDELYEPIKQSDWMFGLNLELEKTSHSNRCLNNKKE